MKLRIQENTIRLRLSRSEITKFEQEGRLEERTAFIDGNSLIYGIIHDKAIRAPKVRFDHNQLMVIIPTALAHNWTTTEQVGFSHEMETVDGKTLGILVEKDFRCLHRDNENKSDLFPNPKEETNS